MTIRFEPSGAWTALVTPFSVDGALDVPRLSRLIDFQIREGIDGILPCGTTGESPTLPWKEHDRVIHRSIEAADGRVGVLAGTGSNNTAEAIRGTEHARRSGASAALLVDCYYNGPSSLELRTEYYERVLSAVPDLPIVPYVIPGRSGCALGAEDLALLHLQDPVRVPAVKEATGDLDRMRRTRTLSGEALAILSGDDPMTLPMMQDARITAAGVVSVVSNIVPASMHRLVAAERAGEGDVAARLATELQPLIALVTVVAPSERALPDGRRVQVRDKFRNPVPVKTMMAGLGMIEATFRPPLGRMTPAGVAACREALRAVHASNAEHLAPIGRAFDVDIAARLADDAVWSSLAR
ncbi:MAG: 4-hydroxy-tetrahydrodipicolinate synthase [Myxococcales bacterium]|nr:4-hydroxy-tetrahydrodipicolinate synthase [Myxococcales bacterium]